MIRSGSRIRLNSTKDIPIFVTCATNDRAIVTVETDLRPDNHHER